MGVYTRLYAPIFNYIHMSQAEKTNTSDTSKKPRLYSRGNDQINLDDYIRNLESGFDAWLNSRKIKDKHKDAVREAYREMVTRLNSGDGSFTSRLGGGFQDSTGKIKNADKGFDAAGVAASYLGHTLRSMNIYKEPEPTPDPSKVKYEDGALGTALRRRLLGSAGTIQDFIDRDTDINSNSVRSKEFRDLLKSMAEDLRAGSGEFSDWTEEQRTKSASDLEGLFAIFDNDGQITDDEYLQLAKVTGMSDLRKMFATGQQPASTVVAPDGTEQRSGRTYSDKIKAIYNRWKPYSGQLSNPIVIGKVDMSKLGHDATTKISNAFSNASVQDLTGIIQDILQGKVLNTRFISKVFSGQNPFTGSSEENVRNFLLTNAINQLNGKTADHNGGLHNFGESNLGAYYIGGTHTDRNTGFVYDNNTRTISEMSIHNIPYWQQYINNWWNSLGSSYEDLDPTLTSITAYRMKNGGQIKKLATGGSTDYNTVAKYDLVDGRNTRYMYDILNKNWIQRNLRSINTIAPDNKQYNSEGDVTEMQASQFFQNWVKDLTTNEALAKYWADNYIKNHDDPKIAEFWKNKWYTDGKFDFKKFQTEKGLNNKFVWDDNLGGVGHDIYARSVWYDPEDKTYHSDLAEGYEADGDYIFDPEKFLYVRNMKRGTNPSRNSEESTSPEQEENPDKLEIDPSKVEERDTGAKSPNSGSTLLNVATNLAPDLLNIGRLYASLRTNNRVADVLRPSLTPVLKDTYERYSPVTGAFSFMQAMNQKGSDTLAASYRPFTSDASLAAARMLEGQRQANKLSVEGFLADDKEIKRTQEQALARQEDNMARRSDVSNFNRASINQTNREKAQLEATRLNKNWRSWDNFLGGVEQRARQRAEDYRSFAETVADDNARREYEALIKPANDALTAWTNSNSEKPITSWDNYNKYTRFMKEAANRYQASRLSGRAGVYGYRYNNPYDKQNEFSWISFVKNGGILESKQDFISQIIKLNNERNS